jgi:Hypoxia induced protein conserved region
VSAKGVHIMLSDPLFYVVAIACLIVLAILMVGIGSFGKGGDFNRKHANRIMRWRLAAQFVAVILIAGFAYLRSGGN